MKQGIHGGNTEATTKTANNKICSGTDYRGIFPIFQEIYFIFQADKARAYGAFGSFQVFGGILGLDKKWRPESRRLDICRIRSL